MVGPKVAIRLGILAWFFMRGADTFSLRIGSVLGDEANKGLTNPWIRQCRSCSTRLCQAPVEEAQRRFEPGSGNLHEKPPIPASHRAAHTLNHRTFSGHIHDPHTEYAQSLRTLCEIELAAKVLQGAAAASYYGEGRPGWGPKAQACPKLQDLWKREGRGVITARDKCHLPRPGPNPDLLSMGKAEAGMRGGIPQFGDEGGLSRGEVKKGGKIGRCEHLESSCSTNGTPSLASETVEMQGRSSGSKIPGRLIGDEIVVCYQRIGTTAIHLTIITEYTARQDEEEEEEEEEEMLMYL
ncbi:hypothetical protein B0H66DRAFT_617505 [Apodospora peruviana]|uniref:Uncharacterized protein n=1 Tax=Apodospora peruviana TaxID=516989 RepID=A0AAE0IK09_9PEZI|nr:hypothetical protein B0H66DRAFT_617505 [Apodospora peruviana]